MKTLQQLLQSTPFTSTALTLTLVVSATSANAAVTYDTAGASYSQNFDSLGTSGASWANDSTLAGWYWERSTGSPATPTTYTASAATTAVGSQILSLGNNSDRAFGGQNENGVQDIYYGLQLANGSGSSLGAFSLTYTGEQWRAISNEGNDMLSFSYQVFDSGTGSLTGGTWTDVGDLDFIAPRTVPNSIGLDGNLEANRVEDISTIVSGINWGDGQELWLRWNDNNPVNNSSSSRRAAMGIDDLSFTATAVPEPSTSALIFGGVAALMLASRRKR